MMYKCHTALRPRVYQVLCVLQGIVHEFYPAEPPPAVAEPWTLTLINGLWSLLLSLALLFSCLHILKARSWRLGRSWLRGLLADYGVPLMVVLWSGVSFAVTPAPGVPRRVATPNTWEVGVGQGRQFGTQDVVQLCACARAGVVAGSVCGTSFQALAWVWYLHHHTVPLVILVE